MLELTDKVQPLLDHLGAAALREWRVLELGPYNGRNTVQLAPHCREIVCVEPRLANVAATAANCAESGSGDRVRVLQGDLALCRRLGSFDLLFHSGVLYHLTDPVEHLRQLPALAPRMLLNTHYADSGRDVLLADAGVQIRGEWKPENVANPRAGLQGLSFWLLPRCAVRNFATNRLARDRPPRTPRGERPADRPVVRKAVGMLTPTPPVELITAGLWHDSIGDLAVLQANVQQLAARGVPVIPRTIPTGDRPCIVGGGALLTARQDSRWWPVLQPCRVPGPHVLNAVAVADDGDYSFVREYRYVSVRDVASLDRLLPFRDDVQLVPCATVLLEPPPWDYCRALPAYQFLGELPRGRYVVCDFGMEQVVGASLNPPPTVNVDTRPWVKRKTRPLFQHRTPDTLLAVLAGAKAVLCTSLHLSILAMAADAPFICYEPRPEKLSGYWQRAGLPEAVVTTGYGDLVDRALGIAPLMRCARQSEQSTARAHLDRIAAAVGKSGDSSTS